METHTLLQKVLYLIRKEPQRWVGEKRNNWDASAMHSTPERGVSFCLKGGLLRAKQQSQEEEEGHDAKE